MEEKIYYLGFSLFPGIGPATFHKLLTYFGSVGKAWKSSEKEMQEIVGDKLTEKFFAFKKIVNLESEYKKCVQKDICIVTLADNEYPKLLKKIHHPPFLLYVKGDVSILSSPKILGIVGTRKITPYGREVTEMITQELVKADFVTVSGLAFGVDATAHLATINTKGKTIAVLGCGVDCCYPRENLKIYDEILKSSGTVVSAFPPGMEATKGSFPARNAIVAGLSQAILVTEGAEKSGSLITANYAKKFGRPVFTVPGPITSSLSKGANGLLKDGGIAVTSAKDILDNLGIITQDKTQNSKARSFEGVTEEEKEVLLLLKLGPLHFDEIVRTIGKDSKSIGSLLSLLELKGVIRSSTDGKYYL